MRKQKVFISSVQAEFAEERKFLANYFRDDALLKMFFEPFIFEEVPANTLDPGKVYLSELEATDIYIGLLGQNYGHEDKEGISPTEREYDKAKEKNVQRWIYLKKTDTRHAKAEALLRKIELDVSRKKVNNISELKDAVYRSAILYLKQNGFIDTRDFDDSLHQEASLSDIDPNLVSAFVAAAKAKRNFPLKISDPLEKVLTALKMLRQGKIVNSALLTFNGSPQHFFPSATIKCAHFHGLVVQKPIPDYKEFTGTVYNMTEQAVDFVLSKLSISTGTREHSNQVETKYEIPRQVIAEAIINAVAHRDYNSKGSIQVSVFEDRIEIQNPGALPPELKLPDLKKPHNSYPHNPLLADCLFLTGEIERYGTGFLEIYQLSENGNLKEPVISLDEGFKVTIWRPSASSNPVTGQASGQVTGQATKQLSEIDRVVLLTFGEMKSSAIQALLELKHRENFRDNYLLKAMEEGLIEMTIPDKPKSPKQRYRLTLSGVKHKEQLQK
jgi:ATP-dependent DNA helicase RecG